MKEIEILEKTELKRLCPYCRENVSFSTEVITKEGERENTPKNGDISICIRCAEISIYDNNGAILRKPTKEELREMNSNTKDTIIATQEAIKTIQR